jgi:hypothetical protein
MLLSMLLARFGHVLGCVTHLSMRHMGVMPGRLMVASFMLGGGFLMMLSCRVAATCSGLMMLCGLRLGRHVVSLRILPRTAGATRDAPEQAKLHQSVFYPDNWSKASGLWCRLRSSFGCTRRASGTKVLTVEFTEAPSPVWIGSH